MAKPNGLLIGDMHVEPNQSLRRIHMLGRFMQEKKPDFVWQAGDWGSMNSLSPHETGTIYSEGQRYTKDIAACNEALHIFHSYYKKMRKKPQLYYTEGNHEYWITRAAIKQPTLWGHISRKDIQFEKYGWHVTPFMQPLKLHGFVLKHYFTAGNMGRPMGGMNLGTRLFNANHMGSLCAHSHDYHHGETVNGVGEKMLALNIGCYLEKKAHYTFEQARWWSGLVMLRECAKGYGSPAKYDFSYLLKHYN